VLNEIARPPCGRNWAAQVARRLTKDSSESSAAWAVLDIANDRQTDLKAEKEMKCFFDDFGMTAYISRQCMAKVIRSGLSDDVECCFHGSRILIHNPERNDGLEGRAKHLSHGLDNRTGAKYLHIEKCRWLPTIPKTLANAAAIFDDPRDQSIVFARSYGMHGIHLVIVRLNASGPKKGEISGQLITHFKHKHGDRQDVLRMRWKRQ